MKKTATTTARTKNIPGIVPAIVATAPIATVPIAPAVVTPTLTDAERPHHPYSPSSLQYLEACPNYQSRQDVIHERTVAGSKGHKVVEIMEDDNELSDQDAEAAAECLDFVESRRKIMQDEANRAWADAGQPPIAIGDFKSWQVTELKEQYLPVDDIVFPDCLGTTAGYMDEILLNWNETYAEMIDWKFGMWKVEPAATNLQGIAYTLGLFKKFPKLQQVHVWFKQPHLNFLTEAVFTRTQIPELYLRVQAVVARARLARQSGNYSMACPCVPACNFCANLGKCSHGLNFALQVSKKFSPLEFPSDITPTKVLDPHNTKLALNLAAVMKVWSESFRRQVTDRVLRREVPVPEGMYVFEMPGRRKIVDMDKFRSIALRYMTEKDYLATLEASFGTVEDVISSNAPRGTKKSTVDAFATELEQFGAVARGDSFPCLKVSTEKERQAKT